MTELERQLTNALTALSKQYEAEIAIGCHILNRMAELGRPSSYALGR